MTDCIHLIMVRKEVTAVRERIERKLGVTTDVQFDGVYGAAITFLAPRSIDLDFLRPDVLPPQ